MMAIIVSLIATQSMGFALHMHWGQPRGGLQMTCDPLELIVENAGHTA